MTFERRLRYAIREGVYYDSLVLMGLHAALAREDGVVDAGAIMASSTNLELLDASGLLPEPLPELSAGDLLVVVAARTTDLADAALARLDGLLRGTAPDPGDAFRPRSIEAALRRLPGANWVAISVPGQYAASVARDALHLDRDVFLYSDNVSIDEEVDLKRLAARKGRFVLGPDCGTAILDGVGLGFANRVRRGSIGLIGASGTGLQAVSVALDRLGNGVSQMIGTGGRDLSAAVGGTTAHRALDRLADDASTAVMVLIGKRPDQAVAEGLLAHASRIDKPVVVYFQGDTGELQSDTDERAPSGCHRACSLWHAAQVAHELAAGGTSAAAPATPSVEPAVSPPQRRAGYLRGLFVGGTLAAETLWQLSERGTEALHSNLEGPWASLDSVLSSRNHTILDLGDDLLTRGRLHPMIDPSPQAERLRWEGTDPEVGAILLDVVLGDGGHPDPAAVLAPAVVEVLASARADGRELDVIALVIGTDDDPQGLDQQIERLSDAGASIACSVERAVSLALGASAELADSEVLASSNPLKEPDPTVDEAPLAVINVGLKIFFDSLESQGVEAVNLDWRPAAGGDERLAGILERLKASDRGETVAT